MALEQRRSADRRSRWAVIVLAVVLAVGVNLVIYLVGRAFGGTFEFTQGNQRAEVDATTVAGFTAVPLALGLIVVALLAPRWRWITPLAAVVAPSLAIVTVGVMTLPVDLDPISTICLAGCHLALAPISVLAVRRLGPGPTGPGLRS